MTAPAFAFVPATKEQLRARVALDGPSGAGKTWTSLLFAEVLADGEKVAVIDTERGSASLYSDRFRFDTLRLDSFDPQVLIAALTAAADAGYAVVIIDSLSHFWMGVDGMLEQVDNVGKRQGGGFAGWKEMRPTERRMIDAILAFPGHVIVTMRTKTEWVVEDVENRQGRVTKQPRRVGTKAEQRDGIEYEFTVVGDLDLEHTMTVSKSRCPLLADKVVRHPTGEIAKQLLDWLNDGDPLPTAADYTERALDPFLNYDGAIELYREVQKAGLLERPTHDDTGEPCSLGDLIRRRGEAAKAQPPGPRAVPTSAAEEPPAAPTEAAPPRSTTPHLDAIRAGLAEGELPTDRDSSTVLTPAQVAEQMGGTVVGEVDPDPAPAAPPPDDDAQPRWDGQKQDKAWRSSEILAELLEKLPEASTEGMARGLLAQANAYKRSSEITDEHHAAIKGAADERIAEISGSAS